jgi:alpha-aminoadipic semialdehyde synthase
MSMTRIVGIRREDKHDYERRVPLTPEAVRRLVERDGLRVIVQPSTIRAFADDVYRTAGATVQEDLSDCDLILAVKEVPEELLHAETTYVFFSHTIKGQAHNMPRLRRLMESGCTLIDYERIVDEQGRRLVFFGRHAGLAGMIDTLSVLGRRLAASGVETAFLDLPMAHEFSGLDAAKEKVRVLGERLRSERLPAALRPFVVGFAGYGNVSQGAQEIYDLLDPETVEPGELAGRVAAAAADGGLFKVVFQERDLVEPKSPDRPFDRQEYLDHPDRYRSVFERHAPELNVLVNAIYWTEEYPRLLTKPFLRDLYARSAPSRLAVVGDISCDLDGSIECTVKATTPDQPAFVYEPRSGAVTDGVAGPGLCLMTTDCLPCELPREASESFTLALEPFVAAIANLDETKRFEEAEIPPPIRHATILWRGELTAEYRYLAAHLLGAAG